MLALFLTASAQLGELQISLGMPEPLREMMSIMEDFAQQVETRRPPPRNPCSEDMQRLQCSTAACLAADLARLAPSCAMLLKGRPAEPSPMPVPALMEEFIFEAPGGAMVEVESVGSMPGGFPAEFGGLLNVLPPELAQLFGEMPRQQPPPPRMPAPQPKPEASEHPCKAEVERCIAEMGDTSSAAIRSCLGEHIDDPGFSSTCKCFLHQVDSTTTHKSQPSVGPVMHVVPIAMSAEMSAEILHPPPPMHGHAFCMLFMPAFIILFALLLRRCCLCLCSTKPQFAAMVPPEQATIKTVEPLMCVAVKEVPIKA